MKPYREFRFVFMLVCFCMFVTGCVGKIYTSSNKSPYGKFEVDYKTDLEAYNGYEALLEGDVNIRERIYVLIQLAYFGYELYPDKCLEHIKEAMELSTKIEHKHEDIGELFVLYARLHREFNEDFDPLPVFKEGIEMLGNYMAVEFKKRNPYRDYLRIDEHSDYVMEVNVGKEYMRNMGYDVGKDKRVSVFYRIRNAIAPRLTINVYAPFLDHTLRNGSVTRFRDIYYYDFLSYYLDLATDGYDILDMPDHRRAANDKPSF